MSQDYPFVVFSSQDAPRLAQFNAEVRAHMHNPVALEARDEDFYRRHTGEKGCTVGFEGRAGIVAVHTLVWDFASYRAKWIFPTEDRILRHPAVWWGGWAVHPACQGQGLGGKLLDHVDRFARDQGYPGRVGSFHPSTLAAYVGMLARGERILVGLYYDADGWNFLHIPRSCAIEANLPQVPEIWVEAQREESLLAALNAGMVAITLRQPGPQLGFGWVRFPESATF